MAVGFLSVKTRWTCVKMLYKLLESFLVTEGQPPGLAVLLTLRAAAGFDQVMASYGQGVILGGLFVMGVLLLLLLVCWGYCVKQGQIRRGRIAQQEQQREYDREVERGRLRAAAMEQLIQGASGMRSTSIPPCCIHFLLQVRRSPSPRRSAATRKNKRSSTKAASSKATLTRRRRTCTKWNKIDEWTQSITMLQASLTMPYQCAF